MTTPSRLGKSQIRSFLGALTRCIDLYIILMRWSLLVHRLTISQMMSICWRNRRIWDSSIIESHLWLLQRITVVSNVNSNSSLKSFRNQTTSHEVMLAAIYSASAVLKATDFCFLLIPDIEADPKVKQHPEVLLRSTTLLAQSASVYPSSLTSPAVYLNPLYH